MLHKSHEFYISVGGKGILYTLRQTERLGSGASKDSFVRKLSASLSDSIKSAQAYVEKFKSICGSNTSIYLDENPRNAPINKWGDGKLLPNELNQLLAIEEGVMPFGLHKNIAIEKLPTNYLVWLCSTALKNPDNIILKNLCSSSQAVLIERGVITNISEINGTLDSITQQRKEHNLKSEYFGEIATRPTFQAFIEQVKPQPQNQYNQPRNFYKLRIGNNVVVYSGNVILGNENETITLKATISEHKIYKETKTTVVKRPVLSA